MPALRIRARVLREVPQRWLWKMVTSVMGSQACAEDAEEAAGAAGPSLACSQAPRAAPANCASMKAGAFCGAMPAKLSVNMRPNTAAGLANEVDAVKK